VEVRVLQPVLTLVDAAVLVHLVALKITAFKRCHALMVHLVLVDVRATNKAVATAGSCAMEVWSPISKRALVVLTVVTGLIANETVRKFCVQLVRREHVTV